MNLNGILLHTLSSKNPSWLRYQHSTTPLSAQSNEVIYSIEVFSIEIWNGVILHPTKVAM